MSGNANYYHGPVQHGDNYHGNINASVVGGRHNTVSMHDGTPYNQAAPGGGYGRRY
jgi:hypothetical protein